MEVAMKMCGTCEETLPLGSFYVLPHTSDGLNYQCIECVKKYNAAYGLKRVQARCAPLVWETFEAMPLARLRKFAPKIRIYEATGCWEWTASKHPETGYGRIWYSKHDDRLAHRVAYEAARGPIAPGMVIDHLCRNRACVNPDHLEVVTSVENVMRGESPAAQNARKTHCKRDHEFTPANTLRRQDGRRECRACMSEAKRRRRATSI